MFMFHFPVGGLTLSHLSTLRSGRISILITAPYTSLPKSDFSETLPLLPRAGHGAPAAPGSSRMATRRTPSWG
eukprot:13692215-Alexandrium_andersonii.AAC.1